MKTLTCQSRTLAALATLVFAMPTIGRASTTMQIVADNDFALFVGTSSSVTALVYQNNASWPDQLSDLSSFTFSVSPSETTFYLLGMGGGGQENVSGTVNNVDMTTIPVTMSSNLGPDLTGFEAQADGGTVADGTYSANLADVRAALPSLIFGPTTPTSPDDDYVATQSPNGQGFHFDPSSAHLFKFAVESVGVTPVPEPSPQLLLLVGMATALGVTLIRRSSSLK